MDTDKSTAGDEGAEAEDSPDEGPAMTGAGAEPSGSETGWNTSQPQPDATDPESMPSSSDS